MKKLSFIIKNILKFWWWQDIEKSNIFIRLMNLGMALFLSFCLLVWMYGENWNIISKVNQYNLKNIILKSKVYNIKIN
ncbi:hypothetical protein [Clostridium perfringens]|uniref:hypothetical protein n=1 Tax=Clostridium perfringens TaxID=1502 RepID=UPI000B38DFAE|nr:hypothetical protein [Clostridium perfringens]MDT9330688.1 hypothetical protein [Clostridium perfringens]MDT9334023.1 hypothetical protein [Clostridium perfringens]OUN55910.1 hypothetical protein B5G18_04140 [Clostridium perfringens]OUP48214.1 hypothetical protein B5F20_02140 [Clostridium perfringens]